MNLMVMTITKLVEHRHPMKTRHTVT